MTARNQDNHPIFNLRRIVLRDGKSRSHVSIPVTEDLVKIQTVKSSAKDPLSAQSLKALRTVRAALNECHQYTPSSEQPRFKASPSRSSDSSEEGKKSWSWSDSSLELKSSESEKKSSESSSSSEDSFQDKESASSSESGEEEVVELGDKYKSFPREWLKSFQRDYPRTGLPTVPDNPDS